MNCPKCNSGNEPNAAFCRCCGYSLHRKKRAKTGFIITFILILALIATGIIIFASSNNDYSETAAIESKDYVDLGLSVKWSKFNVGSNTETGFGNYFGFRFKYPVSNSNIIYIPQTESTIPGYYLDEKLKSYSTIGRLPSEEEWQELIDRCQWIWQNNNGTNGYKIIGPSGNSIFLPAAGVFINSPSDYDSGFISQNERGTYLSDYITYNESDKNVEASSLMLWNNGYRIDDFTSSRLILTDDYVSIRLVK